MDYSSLSANDLLIVCTQGDAGGWAEFVRRFHPLIARVVLRVARQWNDASPQIVEDLVQETFLKLCANRGEFLQRFRSTHENALFGYIKTLAANLARDHFKLIHAKRRDAGLTDSLPDDNELLRDPTSSSADAEREILIREVDSYLRTIITGAKGQRDRRIFWLYYRFGLTANAIAQLPSIALTTKGVETTLLRLTREIRERFVQRPDVAASSSDNETGKSSLESF